MLDLLLTYPPHKASALVRKLLALGYTQKKLSSEVGVAQSVISRLNTDAAMPSVENYYKILVFAASKLNGGK